MQVSNINNQNLILIVNLTKYNIATTAIYIQLEFFAQ